MSRDRHLRRSRSGSPTGRRALGALTLIGVAGLLAACAPASRNSSGHGSTPALDASRAPAPAAPVTTRPTTYVTAGARAGIGGCDLVPVDHAFHASIASLPVRSSSGATIAAIGPSETLLPGFSAATWMGSRSGYPTNLIDSRTAPRSFIAVASMYQSVSENQSVPWPDDPRFEGWPNRAWDRHLLTVDTHRCESWELINAQAPGENVFAALLHPGSWYADRVVRLDLSSNTIPPTGTVTASGLSMLAGLVRYDEVASGRVDHALSMVLPDIGAGATWPASRSDGRSTDPAAPPMGTWFRLRADVDISGLRPQARVVAQAMKDHGVVLVDTGPHAAISGEPDVRWDDADLDGLRSLTIGQFEVVDPTPMKVADGSYRIR